jgi:hypothetical protein
LYGQAILGQTPCFSVLPQTVSIPAAVSQEISSLSSYIAATATIPNPTVSVHVVVDQIFALSLPLKSGTEVTKKTGGLSLGAKIGIAVGAGLGLLFALILFLGLRRLRRTNPQEESPLEPTQPVGTPETFRKSMMSNTSTVTTPTPTDPMRASYFPNEPPPFGWQAPPPPTQPVQYRMSPRRYGETQVAIPYGGSSSLPSYSPPPGELPAEATERFELGAHTPAGNRGWR